MCRSHSVGAAICLCGLELAVKLHFFHLHHHQVDSLFLSNSPNPVCFKCHDVMSCIIDLMIGIIGLYIGIKIIKTTSRLKYSLSWNSNLKIYSCLLFLSFSRAFPGTNSWQDPTQEPPCPSPSCRSTYLWRMTKANRSLGGGTFPYEILVVW